MPDYINVKDTWSDTYRETREAGGGADLFDRQGSFYAWVNSVGIDETWEWSREQFRNFVARNPDREDLWKFEIGAVASPIGWGGTDGRRASFLEGWNYASPFLWVFGSVVFIFIGVSLASAVSPLLLPVAVLLPLAGLFRHIRAYVLMNNTWGKK
jgi:hypothetical protein